MLRYFGTKSNKAKFYPTPLYDTIIEPFAGVAGYSLRHWKKRVILVDRDEKIIRVWRWLQKAKANTLLTLPWNAKIGDNLTKFNYDCKEAYIFFCLVSGSSGSVKLKILNNFQERPFQANKKRKQEIISIPEHIQDWTFIHGDYHALANIEATWFIDPPYQFGGENYVQGNKKLNYSELAEWCRSRRGQVIVCENTAATWMDFQSMKITSHNHYHKTTEAIWSNKPLDYDWQQLPLL